MDPSKTIENFFWAHLFRFSTENPTGKFGARIRRQLDCECKQYVAFELAKMLKQPTGDIYSGSAEELLAEADKKFKEAWAEWKEGDKTHVVSERKWWQFWR